MTTWSDDERKLHIETQDYIRIQQILKYFSQLPKDKQLELIQKLRKEAE